MTDTKKNETNHGLFVPQPCTKCGEPAFELIEVKPDGWFPKVLGVGTKVWIRCAKCDYSIKVPHDEVDGAKALAAKTNEFLSEKVEQKDYLEYIMGSGLGCAAELMMDAHKWDCPKCGEEVPPHFPDCWQCGTKSPHGDEMIAVQEGGIHASSCSPTPKFSGGGGGCNDGSCG